MKTKALVVLCASILSAALARADYISGIAWTVPASTASSTPTLGNTPGAGAVEAATFSANGIDFDATPYNLGGFLGYGGTAGSIVYMNGASAATSIDNTEWEFKGSALFTNGQSFTVRHDDGVNLYVNGTSVLLASGPSGPSTNKAVYSGPTGIYSFDFIYTECCGGHAIFETNLVPSALTTTPEPSYWGLVGGLSLLGMGLSARRAFGRA